MQIVDVFAAIGGGAVGGKPPVAGPGFAQAIEAGLAGGGLSGGAGGITIGPVTPGANGINSILATTLPTGTLPATLFGEPQPAAPSGAFAVATRAGLSVGASAQAVTIPAQAAPQPQGQTQTRGDGVSAADPGDLAATQPEQTLGDPLAGAPGTPVPGETPPPPKPGKVPAKPETAEALPDIAEQLPLADAAQAKPGKASAATDGDKKTGRSRQRSDGDAQSASVDGASQPQAPVGTMLASANASTLLAPAQPQSATPPSEGAEQPGQTGAATPQPAVTPDMRTAQGQAAAAAQAQGDGTATADTGPLSEKLSKLAGVEEGSAQGRGADPAAKSDAPSFQQHLAGISRGEATAKAAAAANGQPPVLDAHSGHLGQDMGVEIARHVHRGNEEMSVRLNPAELGRVEVRIGFEDGHLRAVVRTESPAAMELIRRETADLTRALDQAGVRSDQQSFRFESRSGNGQSGSQQQQHPQQQARAPAGLAGDSADGGTTTTYRALRSNGQLDLLA